MNFGQFLTFISLKGDLKLDEHVMYQMVSDDKHVKADPDAYYIVSLLTISNDMMNARIIYARDYFKKKLSYRVINIDICFNAYADNPTKLFIRNTTMSRLVHYFT